MTSGDVPVPSTQRASADRVAVPGAVVCRIGVRNRIY